MSGISPDDNDKAIDYLINKPTKEDIKQMKKDSKVIEDAFNNQTEETKYKNPNHCRICRMYEASLKDFKKNKDDYKKYPKMEEKDWKLESEVTDWEKEFDEKFTDGLNDITSPFSADDLKDFILKNFIPKKELAEKLKACLPEKKSVEELKGVFGENPFTDLATWVAFKEGYNKSISQAEQNINKLSEEGVDK